MYQLRTILASEPTGHTSLFLTPDGRHAGEMILCSSSSVIVDARVTACSPNLSRDHKENRFIQGEFRSIRGLDTGAQPGYFESTEYANEQAIIVLYPDGTCFFAERLKRIAAQDGH